MPRVVPRLREGLQDVARDVSPVPPLVLHQPPLLLLVQDLREGQGGGPGPHGPNFVLPTSTHGGDPRFYLQRVPLPDAQLLRVPGLEVVQGSDQPLGREGGSGRGEGVISTQPGARACPPALRIHRERGTLTLGWDCPSSRCLVPVRGAGTGKGAASEVGKLRQAVGCPGGPRGVPAPARRAPTRPKKPGHTRAPGRCWGTRPYNHRGGHTGVGVVTSPQIQSPLSRCRRAGPHLDLFQAVPRLFQTP